MNISPNPRLIGALFRFKPGFAAGFGKRAHPRDIGGALRHRNHAARIQQIEAVARFDALIVRRQRELALAAQQLLALLLSVSEMLEQTLGICALEIVRRLLDLILKKHFAIANDASVGLL